MRPYIKLPPDWVFGWDVGRWAATLDHRNGEVLCWITKFIDEMGEQWIPHRTMIHDAFQRLHLRIAPCITKEQRQVLAALLTRPEWTEIAIGGDFRSGFHSVHKPNVAWWEVFKWRGFDQWPEWVREHYPAMVECRKNDPLKSSSNPATLEQQR